MSTEQKCFCGDPCCTDPKPTGGSLMDKMTHARNALLAAQGVVGVSIDGRTPGNSRLAIRPADHFGTAVEIITENQGDGSQRIFINDREEALWLANQLQRIYT